jgi:NitT/TauT family transport system substrate-binding protein
VNVEEDWQATIATLNEAGLLKTAKSPSDYWDSSFAPRGEQ